MKLKKIGYSFDAEKSYLSIGGVFRVIPALLHIGVSLLLSAVIDRILTLKVLACSIWILENSNKLDFTSNYMREHLDTTKCFLHHQKQEIPKWAQHDLGRNMR